MFCGRIREVSKKFIFMALELSQLYKNEFSFNIHHLNHGGILRLSHCSSSFVSIFCFPSLNVLKSFSVGVSSLKNFGYVKV